jgi:glycosyltransferase involved in cell wall biosynthesis
VQRTVSIITTCKGRLEHLRETVPRMLELGAAEVIVVDYSCPDGTADFVGEHFPAARVVSVPGQPDFSNWRARNVGAAAATGQLLLFCDADTLLAPDALSRIAAKLPARSFAFLPRATTAHLNRTGLRLGTNQLRGFHVVPAPAFRAVGGYDDVLEGWGAGGDTELEQSLLHMGLTATALEPDIVENVIQHGNADRLKHHRIPIPVSYGAGLLYRLAKRALIGTAGKRVLAPEIRKRLYATARRSAEQLGGDRDRVALTAVANTHAVGMPRQLGFSKVIARVSIKVELIGEDRVDEIPE